MKFINTSAIVFITLIVLAFLSGCSGTRVDSTTWLIAIGEDTLTVGDAGETWNSMNDNQRELFISKNNTVGEYIVTRGRKALLENELEAAGYMDDAFLLAYRSAWMNQKCGEAARRSLFEIELENVGEDEIDFFVGHLGRTVLFTVNPGSDTEEVTGPVHLPELPAEMAKLIDTLDIGESGITLSGIEVRLDSAVTADSSRIARALADTAAVRSDAANAIANRRFQETEDNLKLSIQTDYNMNLDSTALQQLRLYYVEEAEPPADEIVILESDLGSWTALDLKNEISYYRNRYSVDPTDVNWIFVFVEFLHYNSYCRGILESESPEIIDSLYAESEKNLLDMASDLFYEDRIQSTVNVTQEDMEYLFENLEEPLTIPEKRILQAAHMPGDSIDVYRQMTTDEREQYHLQLPGFENLAADSAHPQITRPLLLGDVPGYHGNDVFLMDPTDTTTWLGPLELYSGTQLCIFRLIEVVPERNANFDEVEDELYVMTRNKLEEQTTINIIRELEEKYGMVINEDILDKLPEDPGTWTEL
ncbi:MAG: hypothetical protein K8S15_12015 [Candidatus Aegiribacteria sp.]|nr:hypothetical protein [Candidatus Aegiribacteria sp.]